MTDATGGASALEARHHLDELPLTPPSKTSGVWEVFRRRYLLRLMVRREIQARYAGTAFGLAWSYINPFTRFLTFYFVFGVLLGRGMGVDQFAIHLFSGMVLINYFSETVTAGMRSILTNKGVVQKMAMPREMFPVASMLVTLWHAGPQILILLLACLTLPYIQDGRLWIPDAYGVGAAALGFAIVVVLATSLALMFCCVNVIFRDFARIIQTILNVVQFSVPMMYPYWIVADRFAAIPNAHTLFVSNPLAIAVMLFQRGFWYPTCDPVCAMMPDPAGSGQLVPAPEFADHLMTRGFIMLAISLVLLVVAQRVFSRLEKRVPEVL